MNADELEWSDYGRLPLGPELYCGWGIMLLGSAGIDAFVVWELYKLFRVIFL